MAKTKTRIRRAFTSEYKLQAVQLVTEKGLFYNRQRRHSSLGYVAPAEFECSKHP